LSSLRNVCINNLMRNIVEKSLIHKTVLVLIAFLLVAGSPSNASNSGPEIMELKSPAGNKAARFPHKKHQDSFACKECHHTRAEDSVQSPYVEGMQIKKCIGCHNADDMSNPQLNSFKLAAHGLCKECHKQNRNAAPTKCSGCHIK
ncbi:MAG: cytochrome c3 family protein, partial [Desulfobulbales bacterium]